MALGSSRWQGWRLLEDDGRPRRPGRDLRSRPHHDRSLQRRGCGRRQGRIGPCPGPGGRARRQDNARCRGQGCAPECPHPRHGAKRPPCQCHCPRARTGCGRAGEPPGDRVDIAVGADSRRLIRRAGNRRELGGQDSDGNEQVPHAAASQYILRLAGLDPGGQPGPVLRCRAADHLELQPAGAGQGGSAEGSRGQGAASGSWSVAVDHR
jgi:hypothetical protein